jgi:hypothetical protein
MQKEAHPNDPRSKIIKGISMLLSKDRGVLLKEGTRQSDTAPGLLNCLKPVADQMRGVVWLLPFK